MKSMNRNEINEWKRNQGIETKPMNRNETND